MQVIEDMTYKLTLYLVQQMKSLCHHISSNVTSNTQIRDDLAEDVSGIPLCTIYGKHLDSDVSSCNQGNY